MFINFDSYCVPLVYESRARGPCERRAVHPANAIEMCVLAKYVLYVFSALFDK